MENSFFFMMLYSGSTCTNSIVLFRFRIEHSFLLWPIPRRPLRWTGLVRTINHLLDIGTSICNWNCGSVPNESYSNQKANKPNVNLCTFPPNPANTGHSRSTQILNLVLRTYVEKMINNMESDIQLLKLKSLVSDSLAM